MKQISYKVKDLYSQYSNKNPHETNTMNKVMTWYGIQMKTINDDTVSKLAEILVQGTNLGIIEGRRLLNQNPKVSRNIKKILNDFVAMQEDSLETIKKFL